MAQQQSYRRKDRIVYNQYIRVEEVRVLDEKGGQLGVMPTREALEQARSLEKDLVLITSQTDPPVVKIIELAKYRYQLQQKASEGRKKSRAQDIKELRFTPFMGTGDFESRLKKVKSFLEKGDKVRLSLMFKGRAITKREFGFDLFANIIEKTSEIATVEMEPKMMGSKLIAQLTPIKKSKVKEINEKN